MRVTPLYTEETGDVRMWWFKNKPIFKGEYTVQISFDTLDINDFAVIPSQSRISYFIGTAIDDALRHRVPIFPMEVACVTDVFDQGFPRFAWPHNLMEATY